MSGNNRYASTVSFWVYILQCADGSYYTGHTDNLETRLAMHRSGAIPGYTRNRRPVTLAFSSEFATREEAFVRERQIKGWSHRKKKALVAGDWDALARYSLGSAHPSTSSG